MLQGILPSWKDVTLNWKAGLSVALVSIPLSISLAIASQATPLQGILTAIWAGLAYSFFAGSRYNIVGPTGALSGIIAVFAFTYGLASLPMLAIIAGVMIFAAYFLRLDRYLVFIPASVLHGFTLGVACIIGLNQLNFALGLSGLEKHEKFIDNLIESVTHIGMMSWSTFGIFALFLIGLFLFARKTPKIPGAIVLAPVGIALGYMSSNGMIDLELRTLQTAYGDIAMKMIEWPKWKFSFAMLTPALGVALVAILETMISAKIADGMSGSKNKYNKKAEMKALAISNVVSGLLGGIPATAALARTSLNVKTGATDKTSAMLSSVFVVVISVFLLGYFRYIPLPVIAAILVFTAVRMIEIHHYKRALDRDRYSLLVMVLVAFITVYEDPMAGIFFGTAIALVLFMEKLSRGQFELVFNNPTQHVMGVISGDQKQVHSDTDKKKKCHTIVYSIKGQLAYLNSQAHVDRFEKKITDYQNVILRFRELYFIDLDGVDAFDEIVGIVESQGKKVYVSGVSPFVEEALRGSKHYSRLKEEGKVFAKTTIALAALGYGDLGYEERLVPTA